MTGTARGRRKDEFWLKVVSVSFWVLCSTGFLPGAESLRNDDEFTNPSHTPTVQLLRPRPGELAALGDNGLLIVYIAPEGPHVVEALLFLVSLDAPEQVIARDAVKIYSCQCEPPPASEFASRMYLPPLENPYEPSQRYMHHEVMYMFGRWEGEVEPGYLTDWLGVRTRYAWDCIKHGGYYKFVPSRRLECEMYDRLHAEDLAERTTSRKQTHADTHMSNPLSSQTRTQGFLPPVDDEYPEYVDVLRSVVRSKGHHYTVVELGASYGKRVHIYLL